MASTTTKLQLTLPSYEDAADIAVLNENAKKLDAKAMHWDQAPYLVTASITSSGALELTGELPSEADGLTLQFITPAVATDGLQAKFAGNETLYPILSIAEGKEPISAGAWDAGVPVSLTVSGGNCFFKSGAGDYGTLPPQTKISARVGNGFATIVLETPDSPYFAGTLLVRKAGSMPEKLNDGVKLDVGTAKEYVDAGLSNFTEYFYRAFAYSPKKKYQTELTNAVTSITPTAQPTAYRYLTSFASSGEWTAPASNYYTIYCVGKGGRGGDGHWVSHSNPMDDKNLKNGNGGAGGGSGGIAISRLYFNVGDKVSITCNASISSFGSYCSATCGRSGETATKVGYKNETETSTKTPTTGGAGGTAQGGNLVNYQGQAGGVGGISAYYTSGGSYTKAISGGNGGGSSGGYAGSVSSYYYQSYPMGSTGSGGGGGGWTLNPAPSSFDPPLHFISGRGCPGGNGWTNYEIGNLSEEGSRYRPTSYTRPSNGGGSFSVFNENSLLKGGGGGGGGSAHFTEKFLSDQKYEGTDSNMVGGNGDPALVIIEEGYFI